MRLASERTRAPRQGDKRIQSLMISSRFKSYPAPWDGLLVLACRKCQKKLKKEKRSRELGNLKKAVKLRNGHDQNPLHIVNVPCMDLCPKHGVTVCLPSRSPEQLFILRDEKDLQSLPLNE